MTEVGFELATCIRVLFLLNNNTFLPAPPLRKQSMVTALLLYRSTNPNGMARAAQIMSIFGVEDWRSDFFSEFLPALTAWQSEHGCLPPKVFTTPSLCAAYRASATSILG